MKHIILLCEGVIPADFGNKDVVDDLPESGADIIQFPKKDYDEAYEFIINQPLSTEVEKESVLINAIDDFIFNTNAPIQQKVQVLKKLDLILGIPEVNVSEEDLKEYMRGRNINDYK